MNQINKTLLVQLLVGLRKNHKISFRLLMSFLLVNIIALSAYANEANTGSGTLMTPGEKLPGASSLNTMQNLTITGKVIDSDGIALPGVNVAEKGTSNGTITNLDGEYTINVQSREAILVFSYVGYTTEEVTVGQMTEVNMTLSEDLVGLEEVVVVGYGTVKKSDVTGALASISDEKLEEMPYTNAAQIVQGNVAGVDANYNSFGLNAAPSIRIRGNRSLLAGNGPLYVVDGVPMEGGINELNTADIESMEILKDASATAIYGSRGANGVILITTKRGKTDQFHVDYQGSVSIKNALRFQQQLTGDEWMEIARDVRRSAGRYTAPYPNYDDDYQILRSTHYNLLESIEMGYEWDDNGDLVMRDVTDAEREAWSEVMDVVPDQVPVYNPENVRTYDWFSEGRNKNAMTQNHQLSFSGGSENVSAYFSLGYVDEYGQGIGERYQRITPRMNIDIQATKWLKVGASAYYSTELTDPGEGLLYGVTSNIPLSLPYDSLGNFLILPTDDTRVSNPIRDEILNTHENRANKYFGSYFAEVSITKDLKYRLNVGQEFRQYRNGRFRSDESAAIYPGVNEASYSQGRLLHYVIDNLLYYNKEIDQHSFGLTLLQSIEARRSESSSAYAQSLPYDSQLWYDINSTLDPESRTLGTGYSREQLASFMGRVNYSFMDRYLLTASLRLDGSSKFYVDNQWDYFPSAALSWKVHQESFMQNVDAISQLKLRIGYGTVGNSGVDPYQTAGRITESLYVFGDDPAKGYRPELIETRNVGWEKTTTTNLGIDFGLFRNRLSGTLDVYRANTSDLLMNKDIPAVTGYTSVRANVGKTRNEGIELTLNTFNMDRGDFRWETDLIFTKNREQIIELADGPFDDIDNQWFIGKPLRSWYDYAYDGIWQVSDSAQMTIYNNNGSNFKPGNIRVQDLDQNDTIDTRDRMVVGSNVPKLTGGITNRFIYKGFELSFFIFYRVGHGIWSRDGHYFAMTDRYATPFLVDYYKPLGTEAENADAVHPAPASTRDKYESAMWYREASFLKLRHVTLSYNLPKSVTNKLNIRNMMVSVQAFNPYMLTDYPFLDPEAQAASDGKRAPNGASYKGWNFSVKVGF